MSRLCIVSTCRSDFGIISSLVKKLSINPKIKSSFILYDIHENKKLGLSLNEIINQKIKINYIIRSSKKKFGSKEIELANKLGSIILKISKILYKIKPKLMILYGDRIELMSFALSSLLMKIPIVHINGGEITTGAYDELVRHSITKISSYHFVSSKKNKNILIQMGEEKKKIFDVGHLAYENVKNTKILNKKELEKKFSFKFFKKNALISFHPVTFMKDYGVNQLKILLDCLEKRKEIKFFLSYPNNDIGNDKMIELLKKYSKKNNHFTLRKSFGHVNYLSMLKNVDFIIGNSSSGILEAPIFKTATINIGKRQLGRIRTNSILDCKCDAKQLNKSIDNVYSFKFIRKLNKTKLQYSKKNSVYEIIKNIKKIIKNPIMEKSFQVKPL
jgi:GDP/UDP-N,N'-diacetylbacillosamine 2-epimerase (hydrolysing)